MASALDVQRTLVMLRKDAVERGFNDLALVYDWSLLRLCADRLQELLRRARIK